MNKRDNRPSRRGRCDYCISSRRLYEHMGSWRCQECIDKTGVSESFELSEDFDESSSQYDTEMQRLKDELERANNLVALYKETLVEVEGKIRNMCHLRRDHQTLMSMPPQNGCFWEAANMVLLAIEKMDKIRLGRERYE